MPEMLAIHGGIPTRTTPFPEWPVFDQSEEIALLEVLRSGDWGVLTGTKVRQFETQFAAFQEAKHGICVPNGTVGLELAIWALGIGPGDEVITSPYTFVATTNAVLRVGAVPVFVDIDPNNFLMDVDQIEAAITSRTKAIMPVHFAGCPVNMDALLDIAQRNGLAVIEDACQAWGAEWRGRRVGALGDIGVFSFQASKNITAGEGGIVVTNDDDLAEQVWSLHNVGRVRTGKWYEHIRIGCNARMTEWQGAILLAQLSRYPEQMAIRDRNARYLRTQFDSISGITPLTLSEDVTKHAWHIFAFRYNAADFAMSRNEFVAALQAEGVPCQPGYLPLNHSQAVVDALQKMGRQPQQCPANDHICTHESVWLPQNVLLGTQTDMDSVVAAIAKIQAAKDGKW